MESVIGHFHLPVYAWLLQDEVKYEDTSYMTSLMAGRNGIGDCGRSNVYPAFENPAQITMARWLAEREPRNKRMLRSVRSSGDADLEKER